MIEKFILLGLLISLSGFFSAAEMAIFSLSKAKIKALEGSKKKNAKKLVILRSHPQRLLINILIGNNLVNISASALATLMSYELFGSLGPAIATGILTVLILIFGEIGPKTFASSRAESYALAVAPFLLFLDWILRPVSVVFESLNNKAVKIFSGGKSFPSVTEKELTALAEIGAEEGVVEYKEKEMIKRVLEFNDIDANDVMTLHHDIFALRSNLTIEQSLPQINNSHYSRIPIYQKNLNEIIGVVYLPDILKEYSTGGKDILLSKIARKPYFIPKQRKIDDIFKDFQRQHNHIAIVLDERGATVGLVTLEDLLEEIVGEIMDESDVCESLIKRIDKHSILVDARIEIKEVNHFLNIKIPGDDHRLISEVILEKFQYIPKPGDQVDFEDFKIIVAKSTVKRIEKVRVVKNKN